jgi:hypothetical protein
MPIAIRIFEPISLAFKDGAMPQLRGTVPAAPCLLCGGAAFPPSRMGCLDADGDQRTFSVCSDCGWNLNDEELKARTIAQLSDNRPEKVAATTTTEKDPSGRRAQRDRDDEALLAAMRSNPEGSIGDWAAMIHKSRTSCVSGLHRLRNAGLAKSDEGRWRLTEEPPPRSPPERWTAPLSASQRAHAHA